MFRRHVHARSRAYRRNVRDFIVKRILHADDPPHKIAMGVAVGIWVTFTPTVPFQMLMVILLSWALRANKLVGIPITWLANPATFIPIFWPSTLLGGWLLGRDTERMMEQVARLFEIKDGLIATVRNVMDVSLEVGWELAGPLWLGCSLVATAIAVPSYYLTRWVVIRHRAKHPPALAGAAPEVRNEKTGLDEPGSPLDREGENV